VHGIYAATSKVENSAQGSSCKLKFVHAPVHIFDIVSFFIPDVSLLSRFALERALHGAMKFKLESKEGSSEKVNITKNWKTQMKETVMEDNQL
jgi:hypothetical protein